MSGEGKRKHDAGGREDGNQRKRKARHHARQVQGPGIFVSCVRGKERKAAHELIDFLEEVSMLRQRNIGDGQWPESILL